MTTNIKKIGKTPITVEVTANEWAAVVGALTFLAQNGAQHVTPVLQRIEYQVTLGVARAAEEADRSDT